MRNRLSRVFVAAGTFLGALAFTASPAVINASVVDGAVDTTFNSGQVGANGTIRSMAFTADDKIYIAGDFTSYNTFSVGKIARLNPNGALDLTFNFNGTGFTGSGSAIYSISVDSAGKIYATGKFSSYNNVNLGTNDQNNVVRLNADGTLDSDFVSPFFANSNFSTSQAAMSVVKSIGDKVFVSGNFDEVTPAGGSKVFANGLVALTSTGAIESSFGVNARLRLGTSNARAADILPVPNSTDIYVTGPFTVVNSDTALGVARLKNDGTRNTEYANTGAAPAVGPSGSIAPMESFALQSDGKLLLAGGFTQFNGNTAAKGVVRVNPDATLDTTFTSPSSGLVSSSIVVDSHGRIYVAGGIGTAFGTSTSRAIVRLKSDGTVDSSFDLPLAPVGYENKVAISPAGKVLLYGDMTKLGTTDVPRLVRITASAPVATTTTTTVAAATNTVVSTPPGQPSNIKVKISGTRADVSWSAPTTGEAPTSYTAVAIPTGVGTRSAQASSVSPTTLSCTATAPATSCTITGLKVGMKYGFGVSASGTAGGSQIAYLAIPVLVPVPKAVLPETGSNSQTLMMLTAAALLLLCGTTLRRSRL